MIGIGMAARTSRGARSNLCLQSEDLGTTWLTTGSPTRSAAAHTASGVTLDLIGDDAAGAAELFRQAITFTGDTVKVVSVHMKQGVSPAAAGDTVRLRDTTAVADRILAVVTWAVGVPTVTMSAGSHVATAPLPDGVYRFLFLSTAIVAANTNDLRISAGRQTAVGDIGDVYVGGVQAEDAPVSSGYIKTTTAAVLGVG